MVVIWFTISVFVMLLLLIVTERNGILPCMREIIRSLSGMISYIPMWHRWRDILPKRRLPVNSNSPLMFMILKWSGLKNNTPLLWFCKIPLVHCGSLLSCCSYLACYSLWVVELDNDSGQYHGQCNTISAAHSIIYIMKQISGSDSVLDEIIWFITGLLKWLPAGISVSGSAYPQTWPFFPHLPVYILLVSVP